MRKEVRKLAYLSKETAKSILSEFMEGFLYLLYISSSPLSTAFLGDLLKDYHYSRLALQMQLRRLHRRGLISQIGKRGFSLVRLNKKLETIRGEFSNLKRRKYNQGWDKKWRILIYDIPERYKIKREYLRKFLKNLGFGKVQDSCWVSPYDYSREVSFFSQEQKILNYICIYEGRFYAGKKIDLLVEDIWSLNELFNEYEDFIKVCEKIKGAIITEKMSLKEYYKFYSELCGWFRILNNKDPFLPREFLRKDLRTKAENVFDKLGKEIIRSINIKM